MKKTFFKALAATAVVGTVIALSGVVASAEITDGPAQTITDKASVAFGEADVFTASSSNSYNGKVINNYFEIVDSSNKAAVESHPKEMGALTLGYRYKFNTTTKISNNVAAIKFTTSGPATIQVIACTGKNDASPLRQVAIYDQNGTALATKDLVAVEIPDKDKPGQTKLDSVADTLTYTTESAGTYYIGNTNGSIYIHDISVSVGGSEAGTNSKVIYAGTDAYALIAVDADELQSLANVGIGFAKNGTTNLIGEATNKVYETVTIDNAVYKGSDIVEGAEYIYGLKLTGKSDDTFAKHSATPARYEEKSN